MTAARGSFVASLPFALDDFQVRALDAIDRNSSVVVAAPTGSGKTVVAEYAVHKALAEGGKAFYTAPIKALSNQKFADLVARYGSDRVGLLTGDNSVNEGAPIVVMTTEVLRNMIYARSSALQGLRYVVLDEVHYLQDAYRGSVWEEVIIHTPLDVDLVCLSATVSNAEELAAWVTSVRGHTEAIIHEKRPIELVHLYMVANRDSGDVTMLPTFVGGRPNPHAAKLDGEAQDHLQMRSNRRRAVATPRRVEVIDALKQDDMLPAIYFIFSRAACDDAVTACLAGGLRLTLAEERRDITAIVEDKVRALSDDDLDVLGYNRFLTALQYGFAAHHAGMVPPFKEAVEACFVEGLVKAVFATETLALGINMPARTVVVEKLSKFNGERHEFLTAGEYTQLTGRAGRRGIDPIGYAAALWTPFVPFEQVAALAARRSYELRSSFRPTSNMAVNLVRRYSPAEAHHLLSLSFAQYRIDAELVSTRSRVHRLAAEMGEAEHRGVCELGDVSAFVAGRRKRTPFVPAAPEREVATALESIRPGDVLAPRVESGAEPGTTADTRGARPGDAWLVVVGTARRRGRDVQLRAIGPNAKVVSLTPQDFRSLPNIVANIRLPTPFNPNSRSFQQAAAGALQKVIQKRTGGNAGGRERGGQRHADVIELDPLETCPDFDEHVRALERGARLGREIDRLSQLAADRGSSITDQFDRVLQLLEHLGYLDGWSVTPSGTMLAGLYHEADLLIAECLRAGVLDGLRPSQLAGLVSVFVYEQRGPGSASGRRRGANAVAAARGRGATRGDRFRGDRGDGDDRGERAAPRPGDLPLAFPKVLAPRWWNIVAISEALADDEGDRGLPLTRPVDPGFVAVAQAWASGEDLDEVLAESEVTGGDFVRTVKALIDLLRQIGQVALDPSTAKSARSAADALFRGVVSASSVGSEVVGSEVPAGPTTDPVG